MKSRVITMVSWRISQVWKMLKAQLHTLQRLQLECAPRAEAPRRRAVCVVFLCAALRCPALPSARVSVPCICVARLMGTPFPQIPLGSGSLPTLQAGAADRAGQETLSPPSRARSCSAAGVVASCLSASFRSLRRAGPASSAGTLEACRILLQTLPSPSLSPGSVGKGGKC